MNNGLPGPSTTDTITGGKTLELSEYDQFRKPHKTVTDGTKIKMSARTLSTELCCPICLDLLTSTMTTKECLHRFCAECITTALMRGNKECPTCRKKIVSKRSLRPDPNFDCLISKIWPDRRQYEKMQEAALKLFQEQSNVKALQKSIEAGMKAQAANRRMRVQGSYDYEKKKRRPTKFEPVSTTNNLGGQQSVKSSSSSNVNENFDEDVEMTDSAFSISETNERIVPHRPENNASSTSETTDASETALSTDSSELSESSETGSLAVSEDKTVSSNSSISMVEASAVQQQKQPYQKFNNVKPPSSICSLNDKMHKWLTENQSCSSPLVDENIEELSSTLASIDTRMEDMRRKGEEIEVELIPAKSLFNRFSTNSKHFLSIYGATRYLKASPDVTMEHFSEYLKVIDNIKLGSVEPSSATSNLLVKNGSRCNFEDILISDSDESTEHCIRRPEYFYILDHNNQIRKIFLHETLYSAFITSAICDNHLQIFFDVLPPNINGRDKLITEIINEEVLLQSTNAIQPENPPKTANLLHSVTGKSNMINLDEDTT